MDFILQKAVMERHLRNWIGLSSFHLLMHHVLNSLFDLAEGHSLVAVVQHGHHCVHAAEHLGQNLVIVGQDQAGRHRLGEGVILLVRRQLAAAGNKQTASLVIVNEWCHDVDLQLHQPVLESCVPLNALLLLRLLLLLGSSLGFGCELSGSIKRRSQRLGVTERSFGWFTCTRFSVVSC